MRVLILNQTFYPDVAATAQHMWELAQYLSQNGHDVTVLTSRNLYGTDQKIPAGDEQIGRIRIRRVGGTAMGKRNILARLADFGSFYAAAAYELARLPTPDVFVALTSPPMIAATGIFLKRLARTSQGVKPRFVYYVMDLYPDAAIASGMFKSGSILDRLFSSLTRRTLNAADAVIALGRDMQELILRRYGARVCGQKIHIVNPWADGRDLAPLPKQDNPLAKELTLADSFNVLYSGNFGLAHEVNTIVKAIELTADDCTIQWLFIGGGKRLDQLKTQAATSGWSHVRFLPYQSRTLLRQSLCLGDVHLVSQLPQFTGIVVPSKLFGILAVGRPTLMIGPEDAECSRIIREHDAGFVIPIGDAKTLVARLCQLRDDAFLRQRLGDNARRAFDEHYDIRLACGKLEAILTQRNP